MPAKFEKCVNEGGTVRTFSGPSEDPKLQEGEYIHICVALDGRRYYGEIKTKIGKDLDIEKLKLKEFRSTGVDYNIEHPKAKMKELFADLRYLGNSEYPTLKKNEKWGDWTLEDVLKYFAKIVDALRSVNLDYIAEKTEDQADSSWWKCYWEAKKYMKSKPTKSIKAITPSDIPHLLRPGGIQIFQPGWESWYEYHKKKRQKKTETKMNSIELDDLRKKAYIAVKNLGDLVIIPDYISLVGSTVQSIDKEPHDVDIVVRAKFLDQILKRKIESQFNPDIRDKLHFICQPEGPTSSYISLYDLALRPQKSLNIVNVIEDYPVKKDLNPEDISPLFLEKLSDSELYKIHLFLHKLWKSGKTNKETLTNAHIFVVEELKNRGMRHIQVDSLDIASSKLKDLDLSDSADLYLMKPFRALKSGGGYGSGEFMDPNKAWEFWGQGIEVAIEMKFDGERQILHKKGSTIKMFSEDASLDYASRFPQITDEIQKISCNIILDGELMIYDKGVKVARQNMPAYLRSKVPPTTTWKPIYQVFDILYFDNEALNNKKWHERQLYLKKVLKNGVYVKRVIPIIVKDKKSFINACNYQRSRLESEGAMLKNTSSDYPLNGRTSSWIKLKNFKEITYKVLKVNQIK